MRGRRRYTLQPRARARMTRVFDTYVLARKYVCVTSFGDVIRFNIRCGRFSVAFRGPNTVVVRVSVANNGPLGRNDKTTCTKYTCAKRNTAGPAAGRNSRRIGPAGHTRAPHTSDGNARVTRPRLPSYAPARRVVRHQSAPDEKFRSKRTKRANRSAMNISRAVRRLPTAFQPGGELGPFLWFPLRQISPVLCVNTASAVRGPRTNLNAPLSTLYLCLPVSAKKYRFSRIKDETTLVLSRSPAWGLSRWSDNQITSPFREIKINKFLGFCCTCKYLIITD